MKKERNSNRDIEKGNIEFNIGWYSVAFSFTATAEG